MPAGAATGATAVIPSQYSAVDASEACSSRGDEEEAQLLDSEKPRRSTPWYKDFQVGALSSGQAVAMAGYCRAVCRIVFQGYLPAKRSRHG